VAAKNNFECDGLRSFSIFRSIFNLEACNGRNV
jgi:hypothetical protein